MKIYCRRTIEGFIPDDPREFDKLKRVKLGNIVEVDIKVPRNVKFHRKFFKLLSVTFENQDLTGDFEEFREAVTIHAGFYKWITLIDGTSQKRSLSIAFKNMDQEQFENVYNRVFDVCLKIIGTSDEELERAVLTRFTS